MRYFTATVDLPSEALTPPPSPRGHRFLGLLPCQREWATFMTDMARQNGNIVSFKYLCQPACLVTDPGLVAQILIHKHASVSKSNVLRVMLGNGLVTSEGEFWRRQRRTILEAFRTEIMPRYASVAARHIEAKLAWWRDGETRDMYREMAALSLEIAAEAFFGADVAADSNSLFEAFQVMFDEYIAMAARGFLVPSWFPTPGNLRFRRALASLNQVVERIIADRKHGVSPPWARPWDLLDMLLAAQQENPDITDQQIFDEVKTFLIGGHETTAIALAWTWYLLGQHPEVQRKLAREARHVLGGRAPTFDHVSRLHYAEKVVKESMRLYPPVWFLTRKTSEDLELGGYRVRKGTTLVTSMWAIHRDPRIYPDPETFNPERWSSEFADRLPKFAYLPFGAGPRRCIGSRFAMMEATMIVAAVSQAFRIDLIPGLRVTPVAAASLRPSSGVNVVLRERCWHGSTQPSFHQGLETVGTEARP